MRKIKGKKYEKGFGGKLYRYRSESEDEDESELEEAGYDDIMEEEFVSGMYAQKEEEEEDRRRKEERRRKKWRRLVNEGAEVELENVSSSEPSDDEY